jgi:hypothetical protein
MGIGQVMPDTGRALAARAGLPWQPNLMAGNDPSARHYQDTITDGALHEAWNAGHGDPRIAASYYFAGPNQHGWGPKTHTYAQSILARMGVQ